MRFTINIPPLSVWPESNIAQMSELLTPEALVRAFYDIGKWVSILSLNSLTWSRNSFISSFYV